MMQLTTNQNFTLLIFFTLFIAACSAAKVIEPKECVHSGVYYDLNGDTISNQEYCINLINNGYGSSYIIKDSVYYSKLIPNFGESGRIKDRRLLQSKLEQKLKRKLSDDQPLVILFYPGLDPCNDHINRDPNKLSRPDKLFRRDIRRKLKIDPIFVANSRAKKIYPDQISDPDRIIENLFFKEHYPCSSFVVIAPDGSFESKFGEYSIDYLFKSTMNLMANNKDNM